MELTSESEGAMVNEGALSEPCTDTEALPVGASDTLAAWLKDTEPLAEAQKEPQGGEGEDTMLPLTKVAVWEVEGEELGDNDAIEGVTKGLGEELRLGREGEGLEEGEALKESMEIEARRVGSLLGEALPVGLPP